jgi:hypothetical protein
MEEKLETEIDLREPRSFVEGRHNILSVRVDGFHSLTVGFPDHTETHSVGNWEVFAMRYWFETRTHNASCPMPPNGISAEADWSLMVPCMFGNPEKPPRIIFVHNHMLPHFVESPLRFMNTSYRFVLVTGGTDMTVPRQIDQRYRQGFRGFGGNDGGQFFRLLVDSPMLIHWFAENRDVLHPKLSTFPTAMSVGGGHPDDATKNLPDPSTILPVTQRPLKVFSSDRVRSGTGQWALRGEVKRLCVSMPEICMTPPDTGGEGISRSDYLELLVSVPFVACVKGGGIDPSPKAWEAVLVGTIPIIITSWLDDAYQQLPLIIIEDWHSVFNTSQTTAEIQAKLLAWATALAPYYEVGSALRNATLERLQTKYWMGAIQEKIDAYDAAEASSQLNATSRQRHHHHHARQLRSSNEAGTAASDLGPDGLPRRLAVVVPRSNRQEAKMELVLRHASEEEGETSNDMARALSDGFFAANHPAEGKSSVYSVPLQRQKRALSPQSLEASELTVEQQMYADVIAASAETELIIPQSSI